MVASMAASSDSLVTPDLAIALSTAACPFGDRSARVPGAPMLPFVVNCPPFTDPAPTCWVLERKGAAPCRLNPVAAQQVSLARGACLEVDSVYLQRVSLAHQVSPWWEPVPGQRVAASSPVCPRPEAAAGSWPCGPHSAL